jgi:hypothetical protein
MNLGQPRAQNSAVLADFKEELFSRINDFAAATDILDKIREWAGEQFFMTYLLLGYVIKYSSEIVEGKEAAIVDRIVQQKVVEDWENNTAAAHLKEIRNAVLSYGKLDSLLILYLQILQRGTVPVGSSKEQEALLRSGLVIINNGKLKIANAVYAKIFDLAWVEQQLPGITRPVAIVPYVAKPTKTASFKRSSIIAIAACTLAILAGGIFTYFKSTEGQAIASRSSDRLAENRSESAGVANARPAQSSYDSQSANLQLFNTDPYAHYKDLFDNGLSHGQSGRWLPMLREFCSISKGSTYYAPAQRQLEQWIRLYPEDIQTALDVVAFEKDNNCSIIEGVLEPY